MEVKSKKILLSLIIFGISGSSYGDASSNLSRESVNLASNLAPVDKLEKADINPVQESEGVKTSDSCNSIAPSVDFDKVEAADAGNDKDFYRDFDKCLSKKMSPETLARNYGTKDGVSYRVGDDEVFLKYLSEKDEDGSERERSTVSWKSPNFDINREIINKLLQPVRFDFIFPSLNSVFNDVNVNDFFGNSFFNPDGPAQLIKSAEKPVVQDDKTEKSAVAKESSSKKSRFLSHLKSVSVLVAGSVIGGGVVALGTIPDIFEYSAWGLRKYFASNFSVNARSLATVVGSVLKNHINRISF